MLLSEITGGPTFSNTFFAGLIISLVLIATGFWAIVLKLFRANQSAKKLLGFLIAIVAIAFTSAAVFLIMLVVTTPGSRY
jgi:hydrogenase/urease accessory protein HupE